MLKIDRPAQLGGILDDYVIIKVLILLDILIEKIYLFIHEQ